MAIERSIRINVEAGRAKAELRSLQGSLRDTDRAAGAAATASRALGAAIAGVVSIQTARSILNTADSYTNLQNKIRTVIDETQSLGDVTNRLFQISNRALTPIEATTSLYQKLTLNTKSLNASQEDLFRVVETVAKAGALANDGVGSLSASLTQLGQAFGGDFQAAAQEFNSILEQTPAIAKAIADGLGVAVSDLKRLGEQGVLSSKLVFDALLRISDSVDDNFAKAVVNVSASFGILQNAVTQYIGEVDQANGVTASISKTIRDVAENFEEIADTVAGVAVPAFTALAAVIASRLVGAVVSYTTKITATTIAQLTATKATTGLSAALGVQRTRLTAATVAANAYAIAARGANAVLAALGGPAGIAITAAGALAIYLSTLESGEEKTKRIRQETDEFINSLENASIIQFTTALFNAEEAADAARSELDKANNELNRLISVGAESSKVTEDLRVKISQLEANVVNAEQEVNRISNTFQDAAQSAREFAGAASGEDNTKNPELLAAAYKKLKGELDEATKIQNEFEETIKQINKDFPEGEKNIELVRLAEKKRDEDLKRLNDRTKKAAERNAKLHRSYADLRGEFEPTAKIAFEYGELMKEIERSTASDTEKKKLQAQAYKKLQEDLDGATTTAKEFLAQFDPIAAAEVRRIDLLKQLEKVQASASEKQALAAEIQRQYNKELDDAIPSFTELNAQFSAADAATVAYVDTLKQLDEAQRLGVDVTELRINALKSYQKASEEGRKQDILNAETSQSFFGALLQGLNDSAQTADSSFDQIREVGTQVLSGLSNEIAKFISTGKSDFRSFASAVIAELLRIQTNELFTERFKLFKSSRDSGGGFFESIGSAVTGLFASRGAAFDGNARKFARGGLPTIGAFSGSVVSTPTKFAAGGTVGQMGEAGAEAILPLQKTASGDLGVSAAGVAAPTQPNVNVDVPVQVINVTERPQDYLTSDAGVRQIINIVNQNRDAIA